jgi:cysteine desulfurase
MHANNETGIIQPVKEIGEALQNSSAYFHIDAAQTYGKEDELACTPFDLLSASSHKIYGPQGIGTLVVKRRGSRRIPLTCLVHGGGQERGIRPGTVPVALSVGFGTASALAKTEFRLRATRCREIRNVLLNELNKVDHLINGETNRSQPHVLNIRFINADSEALMMAVRESHAFSNGSACTSDSYSPSHVLLAMGLHEDEANESIRLSWGYFVDSLSLQQVISAVSSFGR